MILDVNLPDIDGFEVCRRIKSDPATSMIPVVHLSATYQDDDSKVTGLESGADGYLTYPVEPKVLVAYVRALLRTREAEAQLTAAARQWKATFDAMNEDVCLVDKEQKILRCNAAMTKLLGKPYKEIIGRHCWEVVHGTTAPVDECPFRHMMENGTREEFVLWQGDRCLHHAMDPVIDEAGRVDGAVQIFSDITGRKRTEEALRKSEQELNIRKRIAEIFLTASDRETYGEVLNVILEAMESKYGTFAYIDENGDRVVPSMTIDIWEECKICEKDIFFPRETWGDNLWARCIMEKRAISSSGPFKVPDGHIPITRALAAPIIHQGEVVGNYMVGNKAIDYDAKDEELLQGIADYTAPILHALLQREREEKQRRRANEALKKAHNELEQRVEERTAELRRLSSRLIDVQETERKRIARELHDSIGQFLAATKLGLENAIDKLPENTAKESVESLKALIPLILETSDAVRKIHTDLRPGLLDDLGIIAAISWFCRESEKLYSGLRIKKQIDIEEKAIPDSLKIVIFRILQEALHNVVKHAEASLMRVALTKADDQIDLLLEDNGHGFDMDRALSLKGLERGFGLISMKERAELSGGSLAIESAPGTGTTIRASWPYHSTKSTL